MSRCFPFPPPGYEKKTRTGDLDLLLKEKYKEKKQKKEKKDREKREKKEKKDKDRSKEKHRNKDRKDKHKDKKREKDKEKDKHKTADEQRSEKKTDDTPGKIVERNHAAQEKKFADEFIRRIRDDGRKAEDHMVGNFNGMHQRQIEGTVRPKDIEVKEKGRERRIVGADRPKDIETKDKNKERPTEVIGWPKEDIGGKNKNKERQTEGIDKPKEEVLKDKRKEPQLQGTDRSKEEIVGRDYDKERRTMGIDRPDIVGKDKTKERQIEGIHRSKANIISKDQTKDLHTEGIDKPKTVMAKGKAKEVCIEGFNGPKEDVVGREKNKRKEIDRKKEKHKDREQEREEKRKSKDKKREKEEKEKKVNEGTGHKQLEQKLGESGNKLQPVTVNVAAAYLAKDTANNAGLDLNTRKRKDVNRNGDFHDELRPNKLPRAASGATLQLENGCRLETVHNIVQYTPDRQGGADDKKLERVADSIACVPLSYNKDHKINGKIEPRLPSINLKPCASTIIADTSMGAAEPIKPPHPDSQYLSEILSVPKTAEWSDFDDQEWLFSDNNIQTKPSFQSEIDAMPHVWAEALHIESADVHALPYVIPY